MSERESGGLHLIFAIFLGLMLTAFVGVGINTFHPSPMSALEEKTRPLIRERNAYDNAHPEPERTAAERATLQAKRDRIDTLQDESRAAMRVWSLQTSVILIVAATLLMALSIWRADALPVVGNGLLLGGVFTMVYGVAMNIASNESVTRFLILVAAVSITIGLGWWRFVRGRQPVAAVVDRTGAASRAATGAATAPGVHAGDLAALTERIALLEQRLSAVARALSSQS